MTGVPTARDSGVVVGNLVHAARAGLGSHCKCALIVYRPTHERQVSHAIPQDDRPNSTHVSECNRSGAQKSKVEIRTAPNTGASPGHAGTRHSTRNAIRANPPHHTLGLEHLSEGQSGSTVATICSSHPQHGRGATSRAKGLHTRHPSRRMHLPYACAAHTHNTEREREIGCRRQWILSVGPTLQQLSATGLKRKPKPYSARRRHLAVPRTPRITSSSSVQMLSRRGLFASHVVSRSLFLNCPPG